MKAKKKYLQGRVDIYDDYYRNRRKFVYNNIPLIAMCKNDRAHPISKCENS
eukprot:UN15068